MVTDTVLRRIYAEECERAGLQTAADRIRTHQQPGTPDFSELIAAMAAMRRAYELGWNDQCDVVSACLV